MVAQPQPSQQVRRPRPRCGSSVRSYKPASARVAAGRCADLRNDTAKRCYVACRGSAASAALEFGRGTRTPRLSGICAPTSLASRGPGRILVPGLVCTRFGGRVPRADRRSSLRLARAPMGAPRPQQEIPAGGCRLPPAQRAISEPTKRATSVISRLSFHPLTASSGERDRPGLIAAIAQLGRRVPATRARPSDAHRRTARSRPNRHGRGREPCSPITARSETPLPTGTANAALKSGFAARGTKLLQWVDFAAALLHMPPSAAASALFAPRGRLAAPPAGRRSQT